MTTWLSLAPTHCDICHTKIKDVFVDGKTTSGPWANMCPTCHRDHGFGYGVGLGQQYTLRPDGKWHKTSK